MKRPQFKFLRDNKQIVYSIVLIIFIPGVLVLNTWLFSSYFRETIDQSLQERAVSIGDSFNAGVSGMLDSPDQLQPFISNWQNYNSDTESLDVFSREGDSFVLVATMNNSAELGQEDNSDLYAISWNNSWPVAQKAYSSVNGTEHAYWHVVMPLKDAAGEKKALLSIIVSADVINTAMALVLGKSYWILLLSAVFVILLLLVNSRLFEYSILYNKIKEVDAMKDEFISMASHELRTPVTVIRGYASLMLEEADKLSSEEKKEYLSIIDVSSGRLNSLIEDLLNVSRIEQGRLKMDIKETDARPLIEETVKEMKIQSDAKAMALSFSFDQGTEFLINADKDRLKQVLINIIGNSIKYTPSGSVEIKALNRDSSLALIIKDTGIGMTAKEREHLFEKFYRVKNKKTEDIIGTGLGLWITRQIVELMKGSIAVDSMEGVGTQVTIAFPLLKKNNH